MKIRSVEVINAHRSGRDGISRWNPTWVRIETDEGIDGVGEVGLAYGVGASASVGMVRDLSEAFVLGADPFDSERLWEKLFRGSFWGEGGGPVVTGAISAIDAAIWDIKGKALGMPVWKLLGGRTNESLRTYASQIQFGWSPDGTSFLGAPELYGEAAARALADGYDCVKVDPIMIDASGQRNPPPRGLFSGEQLGLFRRRMESVRNAVGPEVDIILELHSFTSKSGAEQLSDLFSDLSLFFMEEPTHYANPGAHLAVHNRSGLRFSAGERFYTRWGAEPYISANAIDVIQPDFGLIGGITEGKKVCELAHLHDITVQGHVCGSPVATAIALQVETVIPNFQIHEHHVYALQNVNRELCEEDLQPQGGRFRVSDAPGLGIRLSGLARRDADILTIA
ncbi:MAG: mandelate racemase/muconate lactonizing enzyme family protein [Geminicoccaceae bacterium]|nr:mandelate racemase/muconate lactonizing enzyme family protein [Geminicoccaceae bacterium]